MVKEKDLVALAHPEYWNERYILEKEAQKEGGSSVLGAYEWLSTFETLRPLLTKYLPTSSDPHILHLGCGNSVSP